MINAVSKERWENAQHGEKFHYDYENFDNYKNSVSVILKDHFFLNLESDFIGKKILESGGGCYPAIYFCNGLKEAVNVEPLYFQFPQEIKNKNIKSNIKSYSVGFEDFVPENKYYSEEEKFDEVWFFNVLQHVRDPFLQIKNAKKIANTIRIFEPIETTINNEHPHSFTMEFFQEQFPKTEVKKYIGGSVNYFHGADCAYLTWCNDV